MNKTYAVILALVLPAGVAAQQPQGGPPAKDPITAVFRTRTLTQQRNLAQAFDSIPASMFNYKPTPAQQTVGYIAQHLATDNYLFCNNFGAMKATIAAKDSTTADSVKATWPRDSLLIKLKASFAFCESAFAQLNDTTLADKVLQKFVGTTR